MCRARLDMATTSLLVDTEREKGLLGRLIVAADQAAAGDAGWMCSVESQAADITSPCSAL